MKFFHILAVALSCMVAGGWTGRARATDERGVGQSVEISEGSGHSSSDDATISPTGQLPRIQERLVSDEAVFQKIQALRNDPDIQAVLSDPSLMEALRAGDLNALVSNPKFMRLLENPDIQEIMKEVR